MFLISSANVPPRTTHQQNKRRAMEKARIQKLKVWHENVKKIARSEIEFISALFKEDDETHNEWLMETEIVKEDP
jgi:hypothetical protein